MISLPKVSPRVKRTAMRPTSFGMRFKAKLLYILLQQSTNLVMFIVKKHCEIFFYLKIEKIFHNVSFTINMNAFKAFWLLAFI